MNILCPNSSLCDYPPPFTNLSSEAPDDLDYFGFYWGPPQIQPPLGSTWTSWSCLGTCTSTVSQADADQCAANENLQCLFNPPGAPPVTGPTPPTGGPPATYPLYWNEPLQVTINCPDGNPFTYLFNGGQVLGTSQYSANANSTSLAKAQARMHLICLSNLTGNCQSDGTVQLFIVATGTYVDPGVLGSGVNQWQLLSGNLPTGLSLQGYPGGPTINPIGVAGNTLVITGTPTSPGVFTFTLSILLRNGDFMQKQYTIEVLPTAIPNQPLTQALAAPTCATGKFNRAVTGSLPPGMSLSQTITGQDQTTGTPTTAGCCAFTITYA